MERTNHHRRTQLALLSNSVDTFGLNLADEKTLAETRLDACAGLITGFKSLFDIPEDKYENWISRVPQHYWEITQWQAQLDLVTILKTSLLAARTVPADQKISFSLDKPPYLKANLKPSYAQIPRGLVDNFYNVGWDFATSEFIYHIIPASTFQQVIIREKKSPVLTTRFSTIIPRVTVTTRYHEEDQLTQNTLTIH